MIRIDSNIYKQEDKFLLRVYHKKEWIEEIFNDYDSAASAREDIKSQHKRKRYTNKNRTFKLASEILYNKELQKNQK